MEQALKSLEYPITALRSMIDPSLFEEFLEFVNNSLAHNNIPFKYKVINEWVKLCPVKPS